MTVVFRYTVHRINALFLLRNQNFLRIHQFLRIISYCVNKKKLQDSLPFPNIFNFDLKIIQIFFFFNFGFGILDAPKETETRFNMMISPMRKFKAESSITR